MLFSISIPITHCFLPVVILKINYFGSNSSLSSAYYMNTKKIYFAAIWLLWRNYFTLKMKFCHIEIKQAHYLFLLSLKKLNPFGCNLSLSSVYHMNKKKLCCHLVAKVLILLH